MGSREFTSRYTAQVADETGFVPGVVVVTNPFSGLAFSLGLGFPAERPQAVISAMADTAESAATAVRMRGMVFSLLLRLVHEPAPDPCLIDMDCVDVRRIDMGQIGVDNGQVG